MGGGGGWSNNLKEAIAYIVAIFKSQEVFLFERLLILFSDFEGFCEHSKFYNRNWNCVENRVWCVVCAKELIQSTKSNENQKLDRARINWVNFYKIDIVLVNSKHIKDWKTKERKNIFVVNNSYYKNYSNNFSWRLFFTLKYWDSFIIAQYYLVWNVFLHFFVKLIFCKI